MRTVPGLGLAPSEGPRIAIVDDDTVIRVGMARLLTGVETLGRFATLEGLLEVRPPVDLVLLDLCLSGTGRRGVIHGAAAVRLVVSAGYRVLIYTNERRLDVLAGCLAAGAHGVIHKAEPLDALEAAIRAVAGGASTITVALTGLAEVVDRHGDLPTLTARQKEVLSARARGEPYRIIGRRLGISARTAEEHMSDVGVKFAEFLRSHSPADLERRLGLAPGDLLGE